MFDNLFSLSDIRIEVVDTADRYMKAVLINKKKRYFQVLRKHERNGITSFELDKFESNLAYEEKEFRSIDSEYFVVGNERFFLEKSELTDALHTLTPIQLDILLKSILLEQSQESLAAKYGISQRMVRKQEQSYTIENTTFVVQPVFRTDRKETIGSVLIKLMQNEVDD